MQNLTESAIKEQIPESDFGAMEEERIRKKKKGGERGEGGEEGSGGINVYFHRYFEC